VNLIKDSGYTVTLTIGPPLGKWNLCYIYWCFTILNIILH
jgi:hypothetical protein